MDISCVHIQLQEQFFKKNDEVTLQDEPNLPVTLSVQFCPNNDETQKNAKVELSVEIGTEKLYEEQQPFWFRIRLYGIFMWEEYSVEEVKTQVTREGAEILVSFARTYLYDTLNRADIDPCVFPVIDSDMLLGIYENDENQEK